MRNFSWNVKVENAQEVGLNKILESLWVAVWGYQLGVNQPSKEHMGIIWKEQDTKQGISMMLWIHNAFAAWILDGL